MNLGRIKTAVVAFVLVMLCSGTGHAYEETKRYRKFPLGRYRLSLGGYMAALDSSVQIGEKSLAAGVVVDTEGALGLDTDLVVFVAKFDAALGKKRRHHLGVGWSDFRRSGFNQVTDDIPIGDTTIPTGSTVDTDFNFQIISLKYKYSLVQAKRVWINIGAGAFVMPLEFRSEFKAPGFGLQVAANESITAPLPVVGLDLWVALTPRLLLYQNVDVFYLKIGDFTGDIIDFGIGLEYQINKYFGIGGGYNFFDLQIDAETTPYPGVDLVGTVNFSFSGVFFYAAVNWGDRLGR